MRSHHHERSGFIQQFHTFICLDHQIDSVRFLKCFSENHPKTNDFFGWIKTSTCCDVSRNRSSKTGSGRTTGCIGAALERSSLGPSNERRKTPLVRICRVFIWCHESWKSWMNSRRLLRSGPFALYDEGWTMDATMCVPNLRRKRICQDLFAAPQRSRSDRYVANRWKCRVQLRWISSEEVWILSLSIRSETQRDPPIYIVI